MHFAREHGAARNEYGGNIQPHRRHEHAGDDLVAVSHEHQAGKCVRAREDLRAVGDNFAGGERIAHSLVPHGDAVAHADGGNDDGLAARGNDALFYGLGDPVQVHMTGNDLALRRNNADNGLFHLVIRPAERLEQRALRGHCRAFRKNIVFHFIYL